MEKIYYFDHYNCVFVDVSPIKIWCIFEYKQGEDITKVEQQCPFFCNEAKEIEKFFIEHSERILKEKMIIVVREIQYLRGN